MEQIRLPALKSLTLRRPARRIALLLLVVCLAGLIGYRGRSLGAPQKPSVPAPGGIPMPTEPTAPTADTPAAPTADAGSAAAGEPTLLDRAVSFIEPFEGRRHRAYRDSRGHRTIGVGFNLDRPGAADDLQRLLPGVSYRALHRGEAALTDAQIDTLLRHDARRAIDTARRQVAGFDALPRDAQLIVIDMTYNTGSLHKWRQLRSALARQDYTAAADAMHRSQWRRQTGRRAEHLIESMRGLGQG